jgi:hypothetical protein
LGIRVSGWRVSKNLPLYSKLSWVHRPRIARLSQVQVEVLELDALVTAPDPQFKAAAGQQVDHRGLFGHVDRVVQREYHNSGAEPDLLRPGGEMRQHRENVVDHAVVAEMVLSDPHAVKAELFQQLYDLDLIVVHLFGGLPVVLVKEVEGRELHLTVSHGSSSLMPCHRRTAFVPSARLVA